MPVEAGASDELLQPLFQFLGDFVVLQSAAKPHLEVEKELPLKPLGLCQSCLIAHSSCHVQRWRCTTTGAGMVPSTRATSRFVNTYPESHGRTTNSDISQIAW